jgi:chromosome partitioning protein
MLVIGKSLGNDFVMSRYTATSTKNDFLLSLADLAQFVNLPTEQVYQDLKAQNGKLPFKSLVPPQIVRNYLSSRGHQYPFKVVSFQMLKGGVAKTTSALNFGLRAAMYGARVLFIDMDQQANLTFALGEDGENRPVWLDIVEKKNTVAECVIAVDENIDLIPSSLNNSVLERVLINSHRNWSQSVKGPLSEIRSHYDLVIVDTAPALSATNTAVTLASDQIVLPVNPDRFSLSGLRKHLADLKEIQKEFQISLDCKVLFTKYDARESTSRELLGTCIDEYGDHLLKNYIRASSEVKNTIGSSKHLFQAKSAAKEDYDAVTRELLKWPT